MCDKSDHKKTHLWCAGSGFLLFYLFLNHTPNIAPDDESNDPKRIWFVIVHSK